MDGHELDSTEIEDRKFKVEPSEECGNNDVLQPEFQLDDDVVRPPMSLTEFKQELNSCSSTESGIVSLSQSTFKLSSSDTGDIHSSDNAFSPVSLTNDATQELVQPGCQLDDIKPPMPLTEFEQDFNPCSSTESVSDNDNQFSQIPLSKETGVSGACTTIMNHVEFLLRTPFYSLSREDKLTVKRLGPHQPSDYHYSVKDGKQNRRFNAEWFKRFDWLTVDTTNNKFFCFNCLLFHETTQESSWAKEGFTNLKNFTERANRHDKSVTHLNCTARLAAFGPIEIRAQIDSDYRLSIERSNQTVTKNRHILDKVIEVIKFCGIHELALRSQEETAHYYTYNKDAFKDLLIHWSRDDIILRQHLETATVNKYTTAAIQNELLDCIYEVYIDDLKNILGNAHFVAIEVDETTDVTCKSQFVIILRFVNELRPEERFLKFVEVKDRTAQGLSEVILDELGPYNLMDKLIAQAYDGASVMSGGHRPVQTLVRQKYPHAHFIQCYAHHPNCVIQKLSANIPDVNLFFASLLSFSTFFSSSPKRSDALRQTCKKRRLPRWNFLSRVLKYVSEYKDDILNCLFEIQELYIWDQKTKHEALGLTKTLEDAKFNYFLNFFKAVFAHTDALFCQFQTRAKTGNDIGLAIASFNGNIITLRENLPEFEEAEHSVKRRRMVSPRAAASEVCDILTLQLTDRLKRSEFLRAFAIVDPTQFPVHRNKTPSSQIDTIVEKYPFVNKPSLCNELEVLYSNDSFHSVHTSSVIKLFGYLNKSGLARSFHEVNKLLEIVLATPVHTDEPERLFSTLKRIKSFARNATSQDRLNALAVLSVHSDVITKTHDFNIKVINKFASQQDRRAQFFYCDAL